MKWIRQIKWNRELKGYLHRWGSIFGLKDPWLRRDFETLASEYGIEYTKKYDKEDNRMYYIVTDIKDGFETMIDFIKIFIHNDICYARPEILGIKPFLYLDQYK